MTHHARTLRSWRRPRFSGWLLVLSFFMVLAMVLIAFGYYFGAPDYEVSEWRPEPSMLHLQEREMPDAFAIQVRNEVLQSARAIPEVSRGG